MITGCSPSLNAKTQEISGSFFKCENEQIIFSPGEINFTWRKKEKMIASFTHGKKVSLGYITPYTYICFHRWTYPGKTFFFFQPIQFRSDLENGSDFHRLTLNRKVFLSSFTSVKNSVKNSG